MCQQNCLVVIFKRKALFYFRYNTRSQWSRLVITFRRRVYRTGNGSFKLTDTRTCSGINCNYWYIKFFFKFKRINLNPMLLRKVKHIQDKNDRKPKISDLSE